jgi:hypothetical protein
MNPVWEGAGREPDARTPELVPYCPNGSMTPPSLFHNGSSGTYLPVKE